jgi:hypothetical protein
MGVMTAFVVAVLAAGAIPADERILLCRPKLAGEPGLAKAEAVVAAANAFRGRFLDYGIDCDGDAEAARAARRAGLTHAVATRAEGRSEGSHYVRSLSKAAGEVALAREEGLVPPGRDAVKPLRDSIALLLEKLPPPEAPRGRRLAPWIVTGAGAVALAAGTGFALAARSAADDADAAATPQAYVDARGTWRSRRNTSAVLLGVGGAALAAGLAWQFVF